MEINDWMFRRKKVLIMAKELNKRKLGGKVERMISEYLSSQGFVIKEMNYRCKQGEIDIIATENGYYVFIEVKYRASQKFGMPEEAVGIAKQKRICSAAQYYLYSHNLGEFTPVRFDVAAVLENKLIYYKSAFDFVM